MSKSLRPFHLAFPVKNLKKTRDWYTKILGCSIGRESSDWIDFNLFGHQIVAHLSNIQDLSDINEVDGESVPIRHFGVILKPSEWNQLKEKFILSKIRFVIEPTTRFKGSSGEQSTMFIKDPSGNALEFKSFSDDAMIFEK
jgi:extradiol dioxygenase family protein